MAVIVGSESRWGKVTNHGERQLRITRPWRQEPVGRCRGGTRVALGIFNTDDSRAVQTSPLILIRMAASEHLVLHDVLCEGNHAHRTLRGIMPPVGSEAGRRPRSGPGIRDQRSGCPVGRRRHWQTTTVSVSMVPALASARHWSPQITLRQGQAPNRGGLRRAQLPRSGFVQRLWR